MEEIIRKMLTQIKNRLIILFLTTNLLHVFALQFRSTLCPKINSLDSNKIPAEFWHHGRDSTSCALEIAYRDKNIKIVKTNPSDPREVSYIYNFTQVTIINAYPRSLLEAPFTSKKADFTEVCVLGPLRPAPSRYRKLIIYTNFIAPSKDDLVAMAQNPDKTYLPSLAKMVPRSIIGIASTRNQRYEIKKRISGKFWHRPEFPYMTDEPKVKVSVKSRPRPHLDQDKTFKYKSLKKGKIGAVRKFEIPIGTSDLIIRCWTEAGDAFIRWRFLNDGIDMKDLRGYPGGDQFLMRQSDKKYFVTPRRCWGVRCNQSKLIFRHNVHQSHNGTYVCQAYKNRADYLNKINPISSMAVELHVSRSAQCPARYYKTDKRKCPNLINGICCANENTGQRIVACFTGYKGISCSAPDDTAHYQSTIRENGDKCRQNATTVAIFGSSAFVSFSIAIVAVALMFVFKKENRDLKAKTGEAEYARKQSNAGGNHRKLSGASIGPYGAYGTGNKNNLNKSMEELGAWVD